MFSRANSALRTYFYEEEMNHSSFGVAACEVLLALNFISRGIAERAALTFEQAPYL